MGILLNGLIVLVLCVVGVVAKAQPEVMRQELEEQWLVYVEEEGVYVPLTSRTVRNVTSASFFLDTRTNKNRTLNICLGEASSLHLNGTLVDVFGGAECRAYNIDSLAKVYEKDSLFLTVYDPHFDFDQYRFFYTLNTSVVYFPQEETKVESYEIFPRSTTPIKSFFLITLLILLIYFAVIKATFPRIFASYYSISRIVDFRIRSGESLAIRFFNKGNVAILFFHSMVVSFIFMILADFSSPVQFLLGTMDHLGLDMWLLYWVTMSVLVFTTLGLKYLLIRVVTSLFKLTSIRDLHFLDFVRLAMVFYAFLFGCVIVFGLGFPEWGGSHWKLVSSSIVVFLLLRFLLILVKLINSVPFRKLHLFSYLCTTEIIPLIISLKIYLE